MYSLQEGLIVILFIIWRLQTVTKVLTVVYNTQNHRVSGLVHRPEV
jgi:hypothetical protein